MRARARVMNTPATAPAARLCVGSVMVEAVQIWFHCPRCQTELAGFLADPRGLQDVCCQHCGEEFDVPAGAAIVIV
jgi:hypothetical protein